MSNSTNIQTEASDDKYMVNSLSNGLLLLELFNKDRMTEMSLSQISEKLKINKSSAYRLLYTLDKMGYIKKDNNKNYKLDIKVVDLAYTYLNSISYQQEMYETMQQLRDSTCTAVHLFTLDGIEVVNLHNVQPTGVFSSNILPGLRWPAYATAIGQVLLSGFSDEDIRDKYEDFDGWKAFSDATPTNIDELLIPIHKAREQNYLVSWQKFNSNMIAAAAPVKDNLSNKIAYALSVSCPDDLFTKDNFYNDVIPKVLSAADKLSKIYKSEYSW